MTTEERRERLETLADKQDEIAVELGWELRATRLPEQDEPKEEPT